MRGYHFNGSRPGRAPLHDEKLSLHQTRREIGRVEILLNAQDEAQFMAERWLLKLRRRERELIDTIEARALAE